MRIFYSANGIIIEVHKIYPKELVTIRTLKYELSLTKSLNRIIIRSLGKGNFVSFNLDICDAIIKSAKIHDLKDFRTAQQFDNVVDKILKLKAFW